MIFSLIVVILIGVIAYFHFVQGLFSAGLSAILATVSALIAVGYTEVIIDMALRGKFSDQATSMVMVAVFALTYVILRTVVDSFVPGNVRFPVMVDKIGSAVLGLVAAIMAMGVVTIAAQALPFGPGIGGYERFPMTLDKTIGIVVPGKYQASDTKYDEVDKEKFLKNEASGLWVPADEMLLGLLSRVSDDTGSLSNGKPFIPVHPDLLHELFGQRLGLQIASRHTALPGKTELIGVYTGNDFPQADQERFVLNDQGIGMRNKNAIPAPEPLAAKRSTTKGRILLIVRVKFHKDDADASGQVAFSPSSVRLVARHRDGDSYAYKNYFPIGTLEDKSVLYVNTPDDFLFCPADKMADLVFEVDEADVLARADASPAERRLGSWVFVEFKRLARLPLADKTIEPISKAPGKAEMTRKEGTMPGAPRPGSGAGGAVSPLTCDAGGIRVGSRIFATINVGTDQADLRNGELPGVKFNLQEKKLSRIEAEPTQTLALMGKGQYVTNELWAPAGQSIIQVFARPREALADKWAWASDVGQFSLKDAGGKQYRPSGALAKVKSDSGQDMLAGLYDATKPVTDVPTVKNMRPTEVSLIFVVPANVQIKGLEFKNDMVQAMQ